MRKEKRLQQKAKNKKLVWVIALSAILIISFSASAVVFSMLSSVNREVISTDKEDLQINPEDEEKIVQHEHAEEIINIAIFGLDNYNPRERGRSDSIMIMSIDKARKKIKLSSIMRDSYVNISGYGKDKINHAYAFGGPQLAVSTINANFGLNITDYVSVNFLAMAKIVDALDGITLEVKRAQVPVMNYYILEMTNEAKLSYSKNEIKNPGVQKLNGLQVVAYARDRETGNGDYERADRQREVMSLLMEKVQAAGVGKYPSLVTQLLPFVTTNMSNLDIIKLGTDILTTGIKTLEQERFPIDGYNRGVTINEVWYLQFDESSTKDHIYKFIYDDIKPEPRR